MVFWDLVTRGLFLKFVNGYKHLIALMVVIVQFRKMCMWGKHDYISFYFFFLNMTRDLFIFCDH